MNPRLSSGCFSAVSTIHHARVKLIFARHASPFLVVAHRAQSTKPDEKPADQLHRPGKSALLAVQRRDQADQINPAPSTLPASLDLPSDPSGNVFMRLFRVGRAYGKFYITGVKAVWFNYQAVRELRKLAPKHETARRLPGTGSIGTISRAEYQLIHRNNHDIGKLPFFGLLVAVFGEWLPLLVPFMPGVVPGTCRIPKQVAQMREKAEKRRLISFRQGITEPSGEQLLDLETGLSDKAAVKAWPLTETMYATALLARLRNDQLHHLSSTLNLHSSLWDRIQQRPPSFLLQRKISKRLAYLTADDMLLNKYDGADKLSAQELEIACEERGIDIHGRPLQKLQAELAWWLARQRDDEGRGKAILTMLFRRPNAWKPNDSRSKG